MPLLLQHFSTKCSHCLSANRYHHHFSCAIETSPPLHNYHLSPPVFTLTNASDLAGCGYTLCHIQVLLVFCTHILLLCNLVGGCDDYQNIREHELLFCGIHFGMDLLHSGEWEVRAIDMA